MRNAACTAALLAAWVTMAGLASTGCGDAEAPESAPAPAPEAPFAWPDGPRPMATIALAGRGEIHIALYPELAPKTVKNFIDLAAKGFYDGTTFHRVLPGFMIQGGDPMSRDKLPKNDGGGGPGYSIPDEFTRAPHERGAVSMANEGRANSGGSQFFIVHGEARHLDGKHSVFGRVTAGMDVVDAITEVEVDEHGRWGAPMRPLENVVMTTVTTREANAQ